MVLSTIAFVPSLAQNTNTVKETNNNLVLFSNGFNHTNPLKESWGNPGACGHILRKTVIEQNRLQ